MDQEESPQPLDPSLQADFDADDGAAAKPKPQPAAAAAPAAPAAEPAAGDEGAPPAAGAETDEERQAAAEAEAAKAAEAEAARKGEQGPAAKAAADYAAQLAKDQETQRLAEEQKAKNAEAAAAAAAAAAEQAKPILPADRVKAYAPALEGLVFTDPEGGEGAEPLTFERFAAMYPTIAEVQVATMDAALSSFQQQIVAPLQQKIARMEAQQVREALLFTLADKFGHDDAADIADSTAYWDWIDKKAPPAIKALADLPEAEANHRAMNAYKEAVGLPLAEPPEQRQIRDRVVDRRRRFNALHGSTVRSRAQGPARPLEAREAMQQAWDEDE